jgi:hypothetical protein
MEWDIQNQKSKGHNTKFKNPPKSHIQLSSVFLSGKYRQISTQNLPLLPVSLKKKAKIRA